VHRNITMLGWVQLPPRRLVQPSRKRRRAHASHQPLSQSGESAQPEPSALFTQSAQPEPAAKTAQPAQSAEVAQPAESAEAAQPARSSRPPRYQQQRPRPLPPRQHDPPLYRRSPVTEPPPVRASRASASQPVLAYAGQAATAELLSPYMHPGRWLVYLRAFIAIAVALLALGYIVMAYEA
jgi:hypothetical protein